MADIKLPALPMHHSEDWFTDASVPPASMLMNKLYTGRQIRARDLEVARVVLEAAAREMENVFGGHLVYGYPVGETIRGLKVSHD